MGTNHDATVDAEIVENTGRKFTDEWALDLIANFLNQPGEWNGGDVCEYAADVIRGTGRHVCADPICPDRAEHIDACTSCGETARLHENAGMPLCDECFEAANPGVIAECADNCNLPLDHVGLCRA